MKGQEKPTANKPASRNCRPKPLMKYRRLFQVKPGCKVSLKKIDPDFTAEHEKMKSALKEVEKLDLKLRELQFLLYAEGKRSLLICLQALDAAGKDGTINHVLGAMNPQGARVHGFKVPSGKRPLTTFSGASIEQAPARPARWSSSTAPITKTCW